MLWSSCSWYVLYTDQIIFKFFSSKNVMFQYLENWIHVKLEWHHSNNTLH